MRDPRFPPGQGQGFGNAWDGGGPQYLPPGPHNRPRRVPGQVWWPGAEGSSGIVYVREVNRFPLLSTLTFALTTASVLGVSEPDTTRIMLGIRNASTSANNVLVAFGQAATINTALFEIPAGGVVFLDYGVPQDDVFLASIGTSTAVLAFANSNV